MGMARGTPLVTDVAAVVKLTGQQGLNNIPIAAELSIPDLLTAASDYVFDRIDAIGVDPTKLSNQTVFERSVAWHFLSMVAETGLLSVDGEEPAAAVDRYLARSELYFNSVRPKTSEDDVGRLGNENVPRVGNIHRRPRTHRNRFYTDQVDKFS